MAVPEFFDDPASDELPLEWFFEELRGAEIDISNKIKPMKPRSAYAAAKRRALAGYRAAAKEARVRPPADVWEPNAFYFNRKELEEAWKLALDIWRHVSPELKKHYLLTKVKTSWSVPSRDPLPTGRYAFQMLFVTQGLSDLELHTVHQVFIQLDVSSIGKMSMLDALRRTVARALASPEYNKSGAFRFVAGMVINILRDESKPILTLAEGRALKARRR